MSVGLYDADFFTYHQTIFNLEIMKMSTYFKKKKEITILSPSFAPEKYTYFYYRKDINDGDFPKSITEFPNLRYGGMAFSSYRYAPLKEEIEICVPDVNIYQRYKDLFIEDSPTNKALFNMQMRGIHFRLSLDGKTIWPDFEKQINSKGRVFFLHDFNLNDIDGAADVLLETMGKYKISPNIKNSLCVKFPIVCNDFESFKKWLNFTFSSTNFKLQYNGMFKDDELNYIVENINPTQATNIIYNPLPSSSRANDFLEEDLLKIFSQVLFLYKNQKQFLLICSDDFKVPTEIRKMFALFTSYGRSNVIPPTSLFYFAKNLRNRKRYHNEVIDGMEAIEVFSYVQKKYPSLFRLFYENIGASFKGGKIEIE